MCPQVMCLNQRLIWLNIHHSPFNSHYFAGYNEKGTFDIVNVAFFFVKETCEMYKDAPRYPLNGQTGYVFQLMATFVKTHPR